MNNRNEGNGDDAGGNKRSLAEMASPAGGRQPQHQRGETTITTTRNQELAWELLQVVQARMNEEINNNTSTTAICSNNSNSQQVLPISPTCAASAGIWTAQNTNSGNLIQGVTPSGGNNNDNVWTNPAARTGALVSNQPLWSQQPLINCLAVLLVLQRLEQVQGQLNQQTSQFLTILQLLSDILGQQFQPPVPVSPTSAMDWILPVCRRDPTTLLGALVAGLLWMSQRQQQQQRLMGSLHQQIYLLQQQQEQQGLLESPVAATDLALSLLQLLRLQNEQPPSQESSFQSAIQQIFQQQQPQPTTPLLTALAAFPAPQQDILRALSGPQRQEPTVSRTLPTSDTLVALLRPPPTTTTATTSSGSESDSQKIRESDISLAVTSYHHPHHHQHHHHRKRVVPEYVNVPHHPPWKKAAPLPPPVHVVPADITARASAGKKPAAAITMPPPRQDRDMVSSLSDNNASSDSSSTASSLTMGSFRSVRC